MPALAGVSVSWIKRKYPPQQQNVVIKGIARTAKLARVLLTPCPADTMLIADMNHQTMPKMEPTQGTIDETKEPLEYKHACIVR
jgi:hypothetical protein